MSDKAVRAAGRATSSLIETLEELNAEKRQNEHLKKLLFQVLDFSKNRVVMGNERILHEEIEKALKNSS